MDTNFPQSQDYVIPSTVCCSFHCVFYLLLSVCPFHCVLPLPLSVVPSTVCCPFHCLLSLPLSVVPSTVCCPFHCLLSLPLCVVPSAVCHPFHCLKILSWGSSHFHFNGLSTFKGKVIHTHEYKEPEPFRRQKVLVMGFGDCAIDAAVEISRINPKVGVKF